MKKFALPIASIVVVLVIAAFALAHRTIPAHTVYGLSFSKLHAEELGLDWKEVYGAVLTELKPEHLRLSAHWPMVEPQRGEFNFEELDYQIATAEKRGADVILAVGHRTPGWPECHTPSWALNLSKEERERQVLLYIAQVVKRYADSPNLRYFQVENEPYLEFATQYCPEFDETFLEKEIALVRTLDSTHPILVTDSGEMGKWHGAWQAGDVFGTSVYLYVWYNPIGPIRYPIGPGFFRAKQNVVEWLYGKKPSLLIELGAEPWLSKPIVSASLDEQYARMGHEKFDEVLRFAAHTGFAEQYLWGAEWWYYMKKVHDDRYYWDTAQALFSQSQ